MKLQRIIAMTAVAAFALSTLTGCPWEQEDDASSAPSSSSSRPSHDSDSDNDSGSDDSAPDTPSSTPEEPEEDQGFTYNEEENCYTITSSEGLMNWATQPDVATADCTLETDITVSNWSPIQNFSAEFDGQGHTIKGLTSALFDTVSGGTVKNVVLEVQIQITGNIPCVGGVVGDTNEGTIMNCTVSGYISNNRSDNCAYAGGIVGENKGTVIGCTVDSDIHARGMSFFGTSAVAGGIAASNKGIIKGCCYTGTSVQVEGLGTAGGITGSNSKDGSITSCYWSCPENGGTNMGIMTGGQVTGDWANAIADMNAQLDGCEYMFELDANDQPILVKKGSAEQAVNRLLTQFWG